MENKKIEKQISLLNARVDCVIDLLSLNGELVKCALIALGSKEQYKRVSREYEKQWVSILKDCSDEIDRIKRDVTEPDFSGLSVEEARALNEAAKRTCEMDG